MNIATCKITLDTKSNEMEKRLFLSITYQRQAYQYSLGLNYKLTKEQFDNKKLKITKEALAKAEPEKLRAEQIIASLGDHFTFSAFKKKFKRATCQAECFVLYYIFDDAVQVELRRIMQGKPREKTT